jgi:signal transduction histidine kinase
LVSKKVPFKKPVTSQVRLQELKRSPTVDDLISTMRAAQQKPGTTVCLPWTEESNTYSYNLTVMFPDAGGEPRWVLHYGFGTRVIAAHATGDIALIHGLIETNCGGKLTDKTTDDLGFNTGSRIPRVVIPNSADDQATSGWTRIRNKAISDTSQRLGTPQPLYDPVEADRQRILEKEKAEKPKGASQSTNILVGDLLVAAGLVAREDLLRFMPVARQTGLPIGRILVESSQVTESLVRAAVAAQSLIRDKQLHFQLAVSALTLAREKDMTFEAALKERGWHAEYYEITNKLGQLLLDAGCLTPDQLHEATEVSYAGGLPLGRVLVLRKIVPELVAYVALSVQVLLRENKIGREEALSSIYKAASMDSTVHDWLKEDGAFKGKGTAIRLGELLILAGIVSEIDLLSAVETSLTQKAMIGQILVKTEVLSEPVLQHALKLQKAVNSQLLNASEAARMLRELHQSSHESKSDVESFQGAIDTDLAKVIKAFGASDSDDLKTILQALLQQKENLAFRLVSEQEELKHRLARELNDTIVADLQMLKKYLAGDEKMSTEQSMEIVDGIVLQVAEICNDFLPKQLHEKGVEQAVKDLVERVARRSGMYCDSSCTKSLMHLPQPVQLHVFRIIQDWVGVIEKFARASKVNVRFEQSDDGVLKIVVFDNGKGSTKAGQVDPRIKGMKGMQNLQERIELIRCYFETKVEIECHPGNSKLELEIISKTL